MMLAQGTPWPRRQGLLQVGQGHWMHWREYGAPDGIPVVCLHGGPGSAFNPAAVSLFDATQWRIIAYDQRGCGASRPTGVLHDNTTAHLVADLERLRDQLDVPQWVMFGGSWGAALALCYAQNFPHRVSSLVLRGVFLARPGDFDWFAGEQGAARLFPDAYRSFTRHFTPAERNRLVHAYWERLHSADSITARRIAQQWTEWEACLVNHPQQGAGAPASRDGRQELARLAVALHYARNDYFLGGEGVLRSISAMAHLPGAIVHGRDDAICPVAGAIELHRAWPQSRLAIVEAAGHSGNAPAMRAALCEEISRQASLATRTRNLGSGRKAGAAYAFQS